jgi:hypothetical protein
MATLQALIFSTGQWKQSLPANAAMVASNVCLATRSPHPNLSDLVGTHSPWCRQGNDVSSKLGAQVILSALLSIPIDEEAIPDDPLPYDPDMDTIVAAPEVPTLGSIELERDA